MMHNDEAKQSARELRHTIVRCLAAATDEDWERCAQEALAIPALCEHMDVINNGYACTHSSGQEPWRSDGQAGEVTEVKNVTKSTVVPCDRDWQQSVVESVRYRGTMDAQRGQFKEPYRGVGVEDVYEQRLNAEYTQAYNARRAELEGKHVTKDVTT